jgi:hypothetical protein
MPQRSKNLLLLPRRSDLKPPAITALATTADIVIIDLAS